MTQKHPAPFRPRACGGVRRAIAGACVAIGAASLAVPAHADPAPPSAGAPYSTGAFNQPEAIILAPSGFSASSELIVPDASKNFSGPGAIFTLGPSGGPATELSSLGQQYFPLGAVVLPSYYGALAGQVLVTGEDGSFQGFAGTLSGSGVITPLLSSGAPGNYASAVVAPTNFGALGGRVLMANETGEIDVLGASGTNFTAFTSLPGVTAFGETFAPAGFGSVAGDLLVTNDESGDIYAINSSGASQLFAQLAIPYGATVTGLRQLAVAPSGFGAYGGDLFVSISGETPTGPGGGLQIFGDVVVVNGAGQEIGTLDQGSLTNPLDPRGLYFTSNGDLIVSNGDPQISAFAPADFVPVPVPEPSAWGVFAAGLFALAATRAARRRSSRG